MNESGCFVGIRKQQQQMMGFKEVPQPSSNPMDISAPGYGSELTILDIEERA